MAYVFLSYPTDASRALRVFEAARDYVVLEDGQPPTDATVKDFFLSRPPDVPQHQVHHIGMMHDGALIGLAGYLFGYPDAQDCYIGLMIVDPDHRGNGIGAHCVAHIAQLAKDHGAHGLLVAVLDANPKGRAFWEAQGFRHNETFPPSQDRHIRHRLVLTLGGKGLSAALG